MSTKVLAIETSCDDTAVAVVDSNRNILFNKTITKLEEHMLHGGIVPEVASRNHLATLPALLKEAQDHFADIDAIAVTQGPGLIGGLIVGVMMAKSLSYALKNPIIPINHLEGHLLTNRMVHEQLQYPFLALLVSGGHCQFVLAKSFGNYKIIGRTLDDAPGEAFDKVGKMMGIPYPGGPKIEQLATKGDVHAYKLPMPLVKTPGCDLSFSGLKTAVKRQIDAISVNGILSDQQKADIAASFQYTVGRILQIKLARAIKNAGGVNNFTICGGVSANQYICNKIEQTCAEHNFSFFKAPLDLCTDNAAMIAWAAVERLIMQKEGVDQKNSWQNYKFAPQSTLNLEGKL